MSNSLYVAGEGIFSQRHPASHESSIHSRCPHERCMKQRHGTHRSFTMFLHLYKKVPPEAGIVCRICAKNVEIVRKSCRSYGYTAPAIYALQKALWCCEFGDDSFGGVSTEVDSVAQCLCRACGSLSVLAGLRPDVWDFAPHIARCDSTRCSARGPTPRARHSVVTSGAWQRPASPTAAPAHD